MKRLFFALPFPELESRRLQDYLEEFKKDPRFEMAKWVKPQLYHFTSFFVGEVPDMLLEDIRELGRGVLSTLPAFTLEFDRIQLFPFKKPAMLWARFKSAPELLDIHTKLLHFLKPYLPEDFENKEPIPHITLARLKSGMDSFQLPAYKIPSITIHESQLFESVLSPGGRSHTLLESFTHEL